VLHNRNTASIKIRFFCFLFEKLPLASEFLLKVIFYSF
jgi:hypothetical protein